MKENIEWINTFNEIDKYLDELANTKLSVDKYAEVSTEIYEKLSSLYPDSVINSTSRGMFKTFYDIKSYNNLLLVAHENDANFTREYLLNNDESMLNIFNKILSRTGFSKFKVIYKPRKFYRPSSYFIVKKVKKGN